ncbi:hypothetical protein F7725_018912 [Dissostichus mawsoni]|uniref:Xylose isomerase n=1 Tax=Dissostichus mawsoni TaxID=36200 RepID=A0A7J5XSU6_DISMA|nr:hypothetical protein F7725_018912 [Dissostichus mawsoni]
MRRGRTWTKLKEKLWRSEMAAQEEFFADTCAAFIEYCPTFMVLTGIPKIPYSPSAGPADVLCFKHYNAEEVLMGRKMEDWLRFSVKYYTFHDRDMAPEGSTLEESNRNLDEITDLALQLQSQTGVRVLWVTCNLFAHPRYMNGAATNPDCHVLAYAGAQVKKGLDTAQKLGAQNFVFWGGREGFLSIHNTDVAAELKHMANFFKMAVSKCAHDYGIHSKSEYREKIGLKCQFLIEPKPKEPCKHQFGMLGSVDSNTGSPDLGWDTDQFPMDIRNATLVMKTIIEQGGLQPGGLNFDAKVRRESTDLEDLFIAHIGAMDTFARGLRNAVRIIEDGIIPGMVKDRYSSFSHGIGQKMEEGSASLEEMEVRILTLVF